MLVQLHQGSAGLRHDALRGPFLLRDARREAVYRDIGLRHVGREGFRRLRAGASDTRRGLLDKRGDCGGLRVDARPNLFQRCGGTAHQVVGARAEAQIGVANGCSSG